MVVGGGGVGVGAGGGEERVCVWVVSSGLDDGDGLSSH